MPFQKLIPTPPLSDEDADAIYVDDDTRIQILDTMLDLPRADKEQCGAFIVRWFLLFLMSLLVQLCHSHNTARRASIDRLVRQHGFHHPAVPRI